MNSSPHPTLPKRELEERGERRGARGEERGVYI